jgi:multiple sugar transport system ATP-binding protein
MNRTDTPTDATGPDHEIVLRGLQKVYDDVVAVDGIDLQVRTGELLVLLGPSGCGKSTTLRMIAGLEVPTEGSIELHGEEITERMPQKRDLSMVFQNYALYPHKTVRENLAFPLGKMDMTDDEKESRIAETAQLLEIEPLLDRKPDQLSGGQRQRVAVGRTIVREPKAFLLDEPLSNLDAKLRIQTRAEIRDLQQRLSTTTVYVTHDQEEAMSIADRLVLMNEGQIEQIGSPKELYEHPTNKFVAGFLGEPSMNFLDVTWRGNTPTVFAEDPVALDELLPDLTVPDRAVRMGIRPDDMYLGKASAKGTPRSRGATLSDPVEFEFELVDPLGHVYELSVTRDGETLVTQSKTRPIQRVGERIHLRLDQRRVHWFDDEGKAL